MSVRVENTNSDILIQCRKQIGMDLEFVKKHVPKIDEYELGEMNPTLKQLNKLGNLYKVPRWVFIAENLPQQYQLNKSVPAFRQFANSNPEIFDEPKVRIIIAMVERFREQIIELREDMGEPIELFSSPHIPENMTPKEAAFKIRKWLKLNDYHDFNKLKEKLEQKGVFIFLTSKYKDWSFIDKSLLRGLALYHSTLPIIVINDSDSRKARSFTLFHELGHLIKKQNAINNWEHQLDLLEDWCDDFSGNVLMPEDEITSISNNINDISSIKNHALRFKVSAYAFLVRIRRLNLINHDTYEHYKEILSNEYKEYLKRLSNIKGMSRNRAVEIINQYGNIYSRAILQAYHNQEIGLNQVIRSFNLKKTDYVFEMERRL